MKTEMNKTPDYSEMELVIDTISKVFGDWNSGYYVDVTYHYNVDGSADGYTRDRLAIDRDIADDDAAVHKYVESEVAVGWVEETEDVRDVQMNTE